MLNVNNDVTKEVTLVLTVAKEDEQFLEDKLKEYSKFPIVISRTIGLGKARRECIDKVNTPYTLVLDVDTVLPENFIEYSLSLLNDKDVVVVAIDYEKLQGHLAFGASLWKIDILRKLYDYNSKGELCECCETWRRVIQNGYKIETLPFRAVHLRKN